MKFNYEIQVKDIVKLIRSIIDQKQLAVELSKYDSQIVELARLEIAWDNAQDTGGVDVKELEWEIADLEFKLAHAEAMAKLDSTLDQGDFDQDNTKAIEIGRMI